MLHTDPVAALTAIGKTLPTVSTFLINLILTTVLCGVPTLLLGTTLTEVGKQQRKKLKILMRNGLTGLRRMNDIGAFPFPALKISYSVIIPSILFTLSIFFSFSIIAPIVGIVSFLAFFGQYIAWKYLVCFVASPTKHDSYGVYFIQSLQFAIRSIIASNVLFLIYIAIKGGAIQAILLIPLPFVVYGMNTHILKVSDEVSTFVVTREAAVKIDAHNARMLKEKGESECASFRRDFFVPLELQPL